MMSDETHHYHAYLLRLWRSEYKGQSQRRASLEQLFAFLCKRCGSQVGNK